MSASTSLACHAAGLIVFYSAYGLLQERILKGTYGPDHVHFTSSSLLVLLNRLFAMIIGVSLMAYRCSQPSSTITLSQRIKPRSPLYAYTAVAACNFLATSCQYEALRYVSFTTQSLAKCAKMVPVLLVGALVYGKTHKSKQWVSAAVVTLGCAVYLFSNPPAAKHAHAGNDATNQTTSLADGFFGGALLLGYLFFDGLTSTTQERVFGKSSSSTDPFGPQSPVLDQMIYVNFCAVIVSSIAALLSSVGGGLAPNLWLLLNSGSLAMDVVMLSVTAALGLIVLLNCISSFGALTSSTIMTCRQFMSILINAGAFGNFAAVGPQGWLGVAWVGSGVFIKMDPRFREPSQHKKPAVDVNKADYVPLATTPKQEEKEALFDIAQENGQPLETGDETAESSLPRATSGTDHSATRSPQKGNKRRLMKQYGVPILTPLVIAICVIPFTTASISTSQVSSELSKWSSYIPYVGTSSSDASLSSLSSASGISQDIGSFVPPSIENSFSSSGMTGDVDAVDEAPPKSIELVAVEAQEEEQAQALEKTYEQEQESRLPVDTLESSETSPKEMVSISSSPSSSSSEHHGAALYDVSDAQKLDGELSEDEVLSLPPKFMPVSEVDKFSKSEPIAIEFGDSTVTGGADDESDDDIDDDIETDQQRGLRRHRRHTRRLIKGIHHRHPRWSLNVDAVGFSSSSSATLTLSKLRRQRRNMM